MSENIAELRAALDLVIHSEEVSAECENANYHSLQGFLAEIRDQLHEHQYTVLTDEYDDGAEFECAVNGCYNIVWKDKPYDRPE